MSRTFQLSGGHPVLDFVNTLDYRFGPPPPVELLTSYADLSDFVRQSGLADERMEAALRDAARMPAAAAALRTARELREALAIWFYAVDGPGPDRAAAIRTLQRRFLDADRHRELAPSLDRTPVGESSAPLRLAWTWGRFGSHPRLPVWLLAHAAAGLLTSEHTDRIHQCKSADCRWLFLDMSRNHSRRWCDMKLCGNRMKARRHQQRLKPGSSPAGSRAPSTN
ncbi:MAG TPA: CGNR zinc finger domain-containing protein [Steroidobacteraceae bacterium]|nr:CGNR zinc finger domain-containing protein [Steroidobacteraceae bacterium]